VDPWPIHVRGRRTQMRAVRTTSTTRRCGCPLVSTSRLSSKGKKGQAMKHWRECQDQKQRTVRTDTVVPVAADAEAMHPADLPRSRDPQRQPRRSAMKVLMHGCHKRRCRGDLLRNRGPEEGMAGCRFLRAPTIRTWGRHARASSGGPHQGGIGSPSSQRILYLQNRRR
jgi:hypothetical protein